MRNASRFLCLLLPMLVVACGDKQEEPAVSSSDDIVVFVTIDTQRADRLGMYGYPRGVSPFLDRLAASGAVFEDAYASMATTVPSHASMFSGLYPLQHGVRRNGQKLLPGISLLPEVLRNQGFSTGAFVAVGFFAPSGLSRGFDHFDAPDNLTTEEGFRKYRPAGETISAAIEWLGTAASGTGRRFLWVHLFDPHTPLDPPAKHLEAIQARGDGDEMATFLTSEHHADVQTYGNRRAMIRQMDKYDAEILYVDSELERLYEYVQENFGESLWLITSDHGEGLGTHQWMGHGKHIYNEQIRVPMIWYSSSGTIPPARIGQLSENIDIYPTLLDLLDIDADPVDSSFGCSWASLILGGERAFCDKQFAFSQRREYASVEEPQAQRVEAGDKFSVQTAQYKYIFRTEGDSEFYRLESDPYEQDNLIGSDTNAGYYEDLLKQRLAWLLENAHSNEKLVDEETLEHLKALGYTQ